MGKIKSDKLHVQGIEVGIYTEDYRNEFISLTDIARYRNTDDPRFAIQNWMRNRNTIEFLGLWECLHNPAFNRVQFDTFKTEAGLNRFVMTPSKWIELTGAVGIATKASYTADRVRETFVVSQTVNVTSTNPLSLSAELSRVVSKLIVNSTDPRISGVDSVRMTFSAGAKGVNPQTGLASNSNGLSNTLAIGAAVGNTSSSASYLFLNADQQSMTVTVETLRTNGTVYSTRTVENVPLQRNAITLLTGPLYTNASGASFTLSTSWIGDTTRVNF
jgi:hypothetical protein